MENNIFNKTKKTRNILLGITLGVMVLSYGEAMEKDKSLSLGHHQSKETSHFENLTKGREQLLEFPPLENNSKTQEFLRDIDENQETIEIERRWENRNQEMTELTNKINEFDESLENIIYSIKDDNINKEEGKIGLSKRERISLGKEFDSLKIQRNALVEQCNNLSAYGNVAPISPIFLEGEQFARNMPGPKIENPFCTIGLYTGLSVLGAALGALTGFINLALIPYFSCAGATLLPVLGGPFLSSRASSLGETTPLLALEYHPRKDSQEDQDSSEEEEGV